MPTPAPATDAAFAALIDRFESQAGAVGAWLLGAGPAHLDRAAVTGTWTLRQLALHMLDSDLAAGHRMKRVASEECPLLIAYDETRVAATCYAGVDPVAAGELFRLHRVHTAAVLRVLAPGSHARVGVHNQRGRVSLGELLAMYVDHVTHHEPFALAKRRALGLGPGPGA